VLPFQKVNKVVCEKYSVWHTSCQNDENRVTINQVALDIMAVGLYHAL